MTQETRQAREARLKGSPLSETKSEVKEASGENPAPGEAGHKCMMPDGRYNPEWKCIMVSANDSTPDRVYAQSSDGPKTVKVGVWVDVPSDIAEALIGSGHDETVTDNSRALGGPNQGKTVVRRVQRFSVSVRDSA
jgi:hypothetical protein